MNLVLGQRARRRIEQQLEQSEQLRTARTIVDRRESAPGDPDRTRSRRMTAACDRIRARRPGAVVQRILAERRFAPDMRTVVDWAPHVSSMSMLPERFGPFMVVRRHRRRRHGRGVSRARPAAATATSPSRCSRTAGADPARQRRFTDEAQAASALNHPNIVTVYDVGMEDDVPYIVSELVEGDIAAQRARARAAADPRGARSRRADGRRPGGRASGAASFTVISSRRT